MERFKVIERETKQKPYSKDALGNSYKYDYMDREKEEINQWIQTSNSRLSSQIEDLETKLEDLNANKKKRMDKDVSVFFLFFFFLQIFQCTTKVFFVEIFVL